MAHFYENIFYTIIWTLPFLDMFNNEIISYGIAKHPSANSILEAQAKSNQNYC